MRSAAIAAMLMAGALAMPAPNMRHRRADDDVAVTTTTTVAWTTVYPGQASATSKASAASSAVASSAAAPSSASAVPTTHAVEAAADNKEVKNKASSSQASSPAPSSAAASSSSSSASSASASSSSSSSGSSSFTPTQGGLNSFQKKALEIHNQHRANHTVSALTYDQGLEAAAQILADRCFWSGDGKDVHDVSIDQATTGAYGQNAAAGVSDIEAVVTSQWYDNEMPLYTYYGQEPPASVFTETGHFTQVVWKGSSKVGCAISSCPNGVTGWPSAKSVAICNYAGPGNYQGEYAANVFAPKGMSNDKDTVPDTVAT